MLWGCVAVSGTGNTAHIDGSNNPSKYDQILETNVTQLVEKLKLAFQQNNDPKTYIRIHYELLQEMQTEVFGIGLTVP